jgi:hypothetical protein
LKKIDKIIREDNIKGDITFFDDKGNIHFYSLNSLVMMKKIPNFKEDLLRVPNFEKDRVPQKIIKNKD